MRERRRPETLITLYKDKVSILTVSIKRDDYVLDDTNADFVVDVGRRLADPGLLLRDGLLSEKRNGRK
jgi:hypothetical protein